MQLFRLFFTARATIVRVLPLMRDVRVPLWLKAAAIAAGLLVVSPFDLLADVPILGLLDDAILLLLLSKLFVALAQRWVHPVVPRTVEPRIVGPLGLPGDR